MVPVGSQADRQAGRQSGGQNSEKDDVALVGTDLNNGRSRLASKERKEGTFSSALKRASTILTYQQLFCVLSMSRSKFPASVTNTRVRKRCLKQKNWTHVNRLHFASD